MFLSKKVWVEGYVRGRLKLQFYRVTAGKKNRKPKTKLEKCTNQKRKTAAFRRENQKTEPKIGQIRKTKNPNALLL